jgi:hypothetical protein
MAAKPKKSAASEHSSSAGNDTPSRKPASRATVHANENAPIDIEGYLITRQAEEHMWQRAMWWLDNPLFTGELSKQLKQEPAFCAFPESVIDKVIAFHGERVERCLNALRLGVDEARAMDREADRDTWCERRRRA